MTNINCTPIKPNVSFGTQGEELSQDQIKTKLTQHIDSQYDEFTKRASEINQKCQPKEDDTKTKSFIGTAVSVLTAAAVSYVGGRFAADKFSVIFSKQAGKLNTFFNNYGSKLAQKSGKLLEGKSGKITKIAKTVSDKVVGQLTGEKALMNVAGAVSVATLFPQLVTIDGNKDGKADITQKKISAYKSLMDNMGVVSELAKIIA